MLSAQTLPIDTVTPASMKAYAATPSNAPTMTTPSVTPSASGDYFAFARIKGDFALVQVSSATPFSPLTTIDIKLFRHEFVSIFRFVDNQTLHPSDITILQVIDDSATKYEEETGTVFLARELMDLMSRMVDPRRGMGMGGGKGYGYGGGYGGRYRYATTGQYRQRQR